MRAFVIYSAEGNLVSTAIVPENVQGQVLPAVPAGHKLTEVDIDSMIQAERAAARPEPEMIARLLGNVAKMPVKS